VPAAARSAGTREAAVAALAAADAAPEAAVEAAAEAAVDGAVDAAALLAAGAADDDSEVAELLTQAESESAPTARTLAVVMRRAAFM